VRGEGLGNQFLGNIRNVDAIIEVVRCFEDPDVVHVHGEIDPLRDIEVIHTELALADLEAVSRRLKKLAKGAKSGDKELVKQEEFFERIQGALNKGQSLHFLETNDEEKEWLKEATLLTAKPILYVANVGEDDVTNENHPRVKILSEYAKTHGAEVVIISSKIEAEISGLDMEERDAFLKELGLSEPGIDRLAHSAYRLLGLVTYFTAGEKEVRAWTIQSGHTAPQAAGVIHSDFEAHFIRAEVFHYDDLIALGSEHKVKEAGKLRVEGKDYIMQDGDIVHFLTSA